MLKVLQIIPNKGWAIDKLMKLVNPVGFEIKRHYMDVSQVIDGDSADIHDWGLWCNIPDEPVRKPTVLTMHHIERGHELLVKEKIELSKPTIIVASSRAVQKDLKRIGFKSVLIPLSVPPQRLRVGYIGADIPVKRFDIIDEACRKADVECIGLKRKNPIPEIPEEMMPNWYRLIDVLVVASLEEPSSMPGLEAQAVGTKVISTKIGMKPHKAIWFDGSVDDLVKKLNKLKPKPLVTPEEYSKMYAEVYKKAYERFYKK